MTVVEPSPTCRAPEVALRFSPDGRVHACCVNDQYQLGRIGERTITEIWESTELDRLRAALARADFSLGCQDCGVLYATGRRLQTHAEQFDRFAAPPAGARGWPRRLEFALSNTCNLQCIQCSGDYSSSIRAQREHRPPLRSPYGEAFFAELEDFLPHLEVAVFIGGEPFLSRECRRVWDLLIERGLCPDVHVTTNATVWDERVEHYLRSLRMSVAVSIDGATAEVNDAIRVGTDFAEVRANRDRFLAATREHGGAFGINHCLMVQNWQELGEVLLEGDRLDADVHVIPVVYPPAHSLLCLPPGELAPVLAALEAQDDDIGRRLDRNRAAWEGMLAHLRLRLDVPSPEPVPVTLAPHTFLARDDGLLAELTAELEAWSDGAVLAFDVEDGVVRSVGGVPDWAEALGPSAWLGRPAPAILEVLREGLGDLVDLERDASPGVNRASFSVAEGGDRRPFRLVVVEWHVGLARWSRTIVAAAVPSTVEAEP